MTDEQNITCVIKNKKSEYAKTALIALGFQVTDVKKRPSELSGGMQRRVAVARAIAYCQRLHEEGKQPILLLDEAIKELDADSKQRVTNLLITFCDQTNCTVISITHDIAEAEYFCHNVIYL